MCTCEARLLWPCVQRMCGDGGPLSQRTNQVYSRHPGVRPCHKAALIAASHHLISIAVSFSGAQEDCGLLLVITASLSTHIYRHVHIYAQKTWVWKHGVYSTVSLLAVIDQDISASV